MCRRRIRVPELWYGDYLASLGAVRIGERRVKEIVDEYGLDAIKAFQTWWLDYSERRMAQAICALPAATLRGQSTHDSLPTLEEQVTAEVTLRIDPEAGKIEVDLRDNVDCVPAGINLSQSCAMAGSVIGILNCIPDDVPRNGGSFRRIDILIRQGSIAGGPSFPHSTSMSTTNVLNRLINAIQSAFTQIGDGYGLAEGGGALGVGWGVYSGVDSRTGDRYINQAIMGNNGGPAGPVADGWITYAMPDCAKTVYIDSVEILEQKYPLRFERVRLVTDSGGPGRFRGGPAADVAFGPTNAPMDVFFAADFAEHPPAGVLGGRPGHAADARKISSEGSVEELSTFGGVVLQPGELIAGIDAGGGGYGNPLEREVERVAADVLERWVSPEAARDVYGVVFSEVRPGHLPVVDLDATAALRTLLQDASGSLPEGVA
jgi:N-methylhydantoinase B